MENTQEPMVKNNSNMILYIILIVAVVVGIGYVLSQRNQSQMTEDISTDINSTDIPTVSPSSLESSTSNENSDNIEKPGLTTISVEGGSYYFQPNEIRVKLGDTLRIEFTNSGGLHDFVIDEYGIRTKQIQSGESESVEFVADKAGTFEYYCSVGQHRQMGMRGNLIVQ